MSNPLDNKDFIPYSCAFCDKHEQSESFRPEECIHKHTRNCFHCKKPIPCSTSASDPHIALCGSCMANYTRCELCNSLVNNDVITIKNSMRVCSHCAEYEA